MTEQAKLALEARVLTGAWSGRALLRLLEELDSWDREVPERLSRGEKWMAVWFLVAVFGFISMVVIIAQYENMVLGLGVFAVTLALYFVFQRLDRLRAAGLPVELRKTLRPVLQQLGQDLHPVKKIRGTIHLTGIDEKRCKLKKDLPPGANRKLKLSLFEEPVCDLRLPLADGSVAQLRMGTTIRRLRRQYDSRGRRIKWKTKWKKATRVTAMLAPAGPVQWEPKRMQAYLHQQRERLSFVEKDGVKVARLDGKYKHKCIGNPPEEAVPAAEVVKMFVRLRGMVQ
jgi:hypothetical protein